MTGSETKMATAVVARAREAVSNSQPCEPRARAPGMLRLTMCVTAAAMMVLCVLALSDHTQFLGSRFVPPRPVGLTDLMFRTQDAPVLLGIGGSSAHAVCIPARV